MGKGDDFGWIFHLTSLQIGDLQSYLSDLSLFLALDSNKFYILVDNRPWLKVRGARPAHFWQLMVTKSRMSPFANTKVRKGRKKVSSRKSEEYLKWFSLLDAATLSQKRALLPVKKLQKSLLLGRKLHRTLYGFIVFEISWADVRGINYLNELQADTSLAVESKSMRRWEFDSICQAASTISSWFSGSAADKLYLKEYLDFAGEDFHDAEDNFSKIFPIDDDRNVKDDIPHYRGNSFSPYPASPVNKMILSHSPPLPSSPYKRRRLSKSTGAVAKFDLYSEETHSKVHNTKEQSCINDRADAHEATKYKDVLLLFRFNDPDLPFKLKQIIISDLRLLTLLEAGLPSWVIFLQSYPVFCHIYRPWMCPLARALYVIISVVTVLIGFYDLYKNVPVLKVSAYRLCGPLLDWIDTWEMVSRVKYLGTMLFLHNFQKAFKWFIAVSNTIRSFLSIVTQPLAGPLLNVLEFLFPMWNECIEIIERMYSVISVVVESSCELGGNFVQVLFSPVWKLISAIWKIAFYVLYPIFCIFWEILYAPIRTVIALGNFISLISANIYELFGNIWLSVSGILKLASASQGTVSSYEVSMWRLLWNDLFSKVFRALRSILHGLLAFFSACNRHRLSIYNHVIHFLRILFGKAAQPKHIHRSHYLLEGRKPNKVEILQNFEVNR